MTTATAAKWACAGCGLVASRSDGARAPLPAPWEVCDEGAFCLSCRRERAAEAAVEAAPADTDRTARARLRRAAVVEFEVLRAPERTDGAIAKSCGSSVPMVAAARRRLVLSAADRQ